MAVIDLSKYTVTLNKTLMAENKISVTIGLPTAFTFSILDTYTLDGEVYKLNRPAKETKGGKDPFVYNLVLEAQQYELNRKIFLLDGNREFTIVGDLEFFVDLVITNILEINSGWSKGDIIATSDKNLTFTGEDCRSVLGRLADEFDVEFKIDGKVITFADQVGQATGLTFQYGLDNGLYQLSRQNVDSKNTVTRVYGFGSTQNLPNDYRSGFNRLVFEDKYLEDTSEYPDIVEGEVTFEDIKPSFEGAITTVTGDDNITISVISMDFDLEAQLNAGVTAKVVFNSGDLLGQQFEILDNSYVDGTKTFTLIATEDATGTTYPNATFKPLVGDLITFVDIHMPASYITAAEDELEIATQTYLDQNKKFRVTYNLTFDNRYTQAQSLDIGDTVILIDTDFNVNRTIRITSISKKFDDTKLQFFTGKISDYVPVNLEQRIISQTIDSQKTIIVNNNVSEDNARRNTLKNRKLKDLVFDPDGYFDTDNIRPLSIETLFLSVGAKSQNFKLATSVIQANFEADENRLKISSGTLYHREVEGDAGFIWTLSAFDQSSLTTGTDYFAYVKCSKTASTGVFLLSTSQLAADPDDGFFYFWLGILYAVVDNTRDFDLTNGMTYINGRTITTGRVQSINGFNYLDLDLNKFALGDGTNGIDWNVTAANTLTLIGALVQNSGGATAGISVFRGAYNAGTTYYLDDTVTNAGSMWRYINATPSSGNTPAEDAYWTIEAAKGDTGSAGVNALTGYLTNETETVAADSDGTGYSLTSAGGTFKMFFGITDVTTSSEFAITGGTDNGTNWTKTQNGLTLTIQETTGVYTLTGGSWTSDEETFTMTGVYSSSTVTKVYTISKAKAGVDGGAGADAEYVKVSGEQSFKFLQGQSVPISTPIVLTAELFGGLTTYDWEYWTGSAWANLSGTQNTSTYSLEYDNAAWSITSLRIRCLSGSAFDIISIVKMFDGEDGATGSSGIDARAVSITTDVQGFTYDTNGANVSPSTSTITATALNTTGTVYYDFLVNGASQQNTTTPTYTYTPQSAYSSMPDEIQVDIREGANTGTVLASDIMTAVGLKAGTDALTLVLSNEAHTLPADNGGTVTSYSGSGTVIRLYEGATELIYDETGTSDSTWKITATPTNITTGTIVDSGNFATVGDQSSMTSDEASISYLIEGKRSTGVVISLTKVQSFSKSIKGDTGLTGSAGSDGSDGVDARAVNLTSAEQGFDYDTNGANPSPASTTVTATALNTTGTVYYEFFLNDSSEQNTTSNTYTYTPQALYSNMHDKIEVDIREGSSGNPILAKDQMTMVGLKAGENAITIVLSNEAHTLPTTNAGVVTYAGSGTTIQVWEGTTQLTIDQSASYDNSTFRVTAGVEFIGDFDTVDFDDFDDGLFFITPITNITVGSQSGADGSNTITYADASAMNANSAYIPFNITVKNSAGVEFNFSRIQSFAKSIEGADGGGTGDVGASPVYQGIYSAGTDYYGDGIRVDIVKYSGDNLYYIARVDAPVSPFQGIVPTNTTYWNSFGANFESVATDLLFAAFAYIDKLGVNTLSTQGSGTSAGTGQRIFIDGDTNEMTFFNDDEEAVLKLSNTGMVAQMVDSIFKSTTVGIGDLDGSVVNTQANVTGQEEIFAIAITGISGTADISCNGVTETMTFVSDVDISITNFVITSAGNFSAAGCTITNDGFDNLILTSAVGIAFTSDPTIVNVISDLDGTPSQTQAPIISAKRIDTVTLTGTDGVANITCDANTEQANWAGSLEQTTSDFAFLHAAGYLSGGVVVTSSGDNIIFTADVAGVDFTGSTTIANTPDAGLGSIKIEGNQIWENDVTNDSNSLISINQKGYLGGKTKYRHLAIGNGRGDLMMFFHGGLDQITSYADILAIDGVTFRFDNIPTSGSGLSPGEVYRDGAGADAALKIK